MIGCGHGWVVPDPFGSQAKCGGPLICSECLQDHVLLTGAVRELYYWQNDDLRNFHSFLFYCIAKADHFNLSRLAQGFHWEVEAFSQWQASENESLFFFKFGFMPKPLSVTEPRPEDSEPPKK